MCACARACAIQLEPCKFDSSTSAIVDWHALVCALSDPVSSAEGGHVLNWQDVMRVQVIHTRARQRSRACSLPGQASTACAWQISRSGSIPVAGHHCNHVNPKFYLINSVSAGSDGGSQVLSPEQASESFVSCLFNMSDTNASVKRAHDCVHNLFGTPF